MKQFILLISIAGGLLMGCKGKDSGGVTVTSDDGKTTAKVDINNLTQAADALQKKEQELQKLTPYSLDQMKAMLPETLAGVKRSKFEANSAMGAAFAEADYKINDSTEISLKVFDCAGQAGAGIYSMQYLAMMNFQSENDEEFTKTVEFNGGKAIEHGQKDGSRSSFTYLAADRLLITLEGDHISSDQLRKTAEGLNFK